MKSKMFGNVALWLALCGALLGLAACSEKSTAGATVDDNSVAEISADEKLILEHQVDSVKNFVDGIPADIDDYERDTTRFWFEIRFSGEHENFFAYEEENPYSYCDVRIYPSEYGVKAIGYIPNGIVGYVQTFFLTADSEGVAYHEKLDGFYYDEYSCEKYYADFEKNCNAEGWTLSRHLVKCQESPELHLTCSSSGERLTESPKAVLERYAEKMKNWYLENR
jgi:hypothetical protein